MRFSNIIVLVAGVQKASAFVLPQRTHAVNSLRKADDRAVSHVLQFSPFLDVAMAVSEVSASSTGSAINFGLSDLLLLSPLAALAAGRQALVNREGIKKEVMFTEQALEDTKKQLEQSNNIVTLSFGTAALSLVLVLANIFGGRFGTQNTVSFPSSTLARTTVNQGVLRPRGRVVEASTTLIEASTQSPINSLITKLGADSAETLSSLSETSPAEKSTSSPEDTASTPLLESVVRQELLASKQVPESDIRQEVTAGEPVVSSEAVESKPSPEPVVLSEPVAAQVATSVESPAKAASATESAEESLLKGAAAVEAMKSVRTEAQQAENSEREDLPQQEIVEKAGSAAIVLTEPNYGSLLQKLEEKTAESPTTENPSVKIATETFANDDTVFSAQKDDIINSESRDALDVAVTPRSDAVAPRVGKDLISPFSLNIPEFDGLAAFLNDQPDTLILGGAGAAAAAIVTGALIITNAGAEKDIAVKPSMQKRRPVKIGSGSTYLDSIATGQATLSISGKATGDNSYLGKLQRSSATLKSTKGRPAVSGSYLDALATKGSRSPTGKSSLGSSYLDALPKSSLLTSQLSTAQATEASSQKTQDKKGVPQISKMTEISNVKIENEVTSPNAEESQKVNGQIQASVAGSYLASLGETDAAPKLKPTVLEKKVETPSFSSGVSGSYLSTIGGSPLIEPSTQRNAFAKKTYAPSSSRAASAAPTGGFGKSYLDALSGAPQAPVVTNGQYSSSNGVSLEGQREKIPPRSDFSSVLENAGSVTGSHLDVLTPSSRSAPATSKSYSAFGRNLSKAQSGVAKESYLSSL